MSRRFPKELDDFVREKAATNSCRELAKIITEEYPEYPMTENQVREFCKKRCIKTARQPYPTKHPEEYIEWLKREAPGTPSKKLWCRSIHEYGYDITYKKMVSLAKRNGAKNGLDTTFPKGYIPWTKRVAGTGVIKASSTAFKKGHVAYNRSPVGTIVKNTDGYWEKKVADPDVWMFLQRAVWIESGREVGKDEVIIFADGNRENFSLDNLIKVSKAEFSKMNKRGEKTAERTRCNIALAKIKIKREEIERRIACETD